MAIESDRQNVGQISRKLSKLFTGRRGRVGVGVTFHKWQKTTKIQTRNINKKKEKEKTKQKGLPGK